ncbi:MAG: MFS transporter [Proteobacteria bacterium]|nr:MFS transporter [Pseudomonadota bacterium]
MEAAPAVSVRQDSKILGVVSAGHFLSHFYLLTLPPLFFILKSEFAVSYAALGAILTVSFAISAVAQVPMGFLVDRIGARIVLTTGLVIMAVCIGLIGFAATYWQILILFTLAGIGHSVFHPADYAILNASIEPSRMGRAFSIHTFSGHLGSALAPATVIFIATAWNWRAALFIAGAMGLIATVVLASQWNSLRDDIVPAKKPEAETPASGPRPKDGMALLFSKPILLFFLFFLMTSMTASGVHAFLVVALIELHDMPLGLASATLTGYLIASAAGILLGGVFADRTTRHDLQAALAFTVSALLILVVAAASLNLALMVAVLVLAGLMQGIVRPARDMMVRGASPKGSMGKVFGFVSAGMAAGSAISPMMFGFVMDLGRPEWVFYLMVIFMVVAIGTVMTPKEPAA